MYVASFEVCMSVLVYGRAAVACIGVLVYGRATVFMHTNQIQ